MNQYFFLFIFGVILYIIGNFFQYVFRRILGKLSKPKIFFVERSRIKGQIVLIDIRLFLFYISIGFNFAKLYFIISYPFSNLLT